MSALPIAVLASGAGTNLQALIDSVHARGEARIVAVASDQPDAPALERARQAGIETKLFAANSYVDGRFERDVAMAAWVRERGAALVVLAGYMQLLSPGFLDVFPDRIINVHPALLPAFPGLDAVGQALAYGVTVFGVTVHFVDAGVDSGRIILQRAVELPSARTREDVIAVIRPIEHSILPEVVRLIAQGRVTTDGTHPRRVLID